MMTYCIGIFDSRPTRLIERLRSKMIGTRLEQTVGGTWILFVSKGRSKAALAVRDRTD